MSVLLGQFTAWVAVEQRVKQVQEWPYTASIRQGLALSLLLPVVIGALQGLLAEALMGMVR
jgi:hypothetical protein